MIIRRLKEFIRQAGFWKYFINTAWVFTEQLLRVVAGFLVWIYIARYLGPEKFGIFNYVFVLVGFFGIIAKLGLDNIVVRELVNYPERANLYLGTAFWLKSAAGILALGVSAAATLIIPNDPRTNVYILIIACGLIFQQFEVVDFYFQSQALSKNVSVFKIIQLIISCLLKLYLILIKSGLFWFVMAGLFDQVLLAIFYCFIAWYRKIGLFFKCFKARVAGEMLKDAWPLFFYSFAGMVFMRSDQMMIKGMLGVKQVGLYSAVVGIAEAWYFTPFIIASSLFPAILNAKKNNRELYLLRLRQLYNLMLQMSLSFAVLMTFFSGPLIRLFYGQTFDEVSGVLAVNVWAGVFAALGAVRFKWLVSENLQIILVKTTVLGAVLNVILNYILIPQCGIMGSSIATIISSAFMVYASLFFYKETREHFYLLTKVFNPAQWLSIPKGRKND
ncbi:MAG TPA: flippase [Candidatus Omnitrophota bacterium]|nr:flippase [Candidatus Omnitrophota bacterium]HPT39702.1 flippase [Candidatus Omnitrophota bacterium]